jgi:hypothetical protein
MRVLINHKAKEAPAKTTKMMISTMKIMSMALNPRARDRLWRKKVELQVA